MEIEMGKRIILKVINNNPQVLNIDIDEIKRLFYEECYKKLERIRDLIYNINMDESRCINEIYKVLFE